jgi:uncharacterized metal-binding protein YceD (DUF177 family)
MKETGVIMKELKEFTIPFVGLKIGEHRFNFEIEKPFFDHFEYDEFHDASIALEVLLVKKATLLEFMLSFQGSVGVHCDITNEPYSQPVNGTYRFVVKFGDEYNDENEDLLVLPHGSYEVNIQQYVYESIVLSVPARRIHPGVEDGSLKSEILEKLEELRVKERTEEIDNDQEEEGTDPRWDQLKKLLTDK